MADFFTPFVDFISNIGKKVNTAEQTYVADTSRNAAMNLVLGAGIGLAGLFILWKSGIIKKVASNTSTIIRAIK